MAYTLLTLACISRPRRLDEANVFETHFSCHLLLMQAPKETRGSPPPCPLSRRTTGQRTCHARSMSTWRPRQSCSRRSPGTRQTSRSTRAMYPQSPCRATSPPRAASSPMPPSIWPPTATGGARVAPPGKRMEPGLLSTLQTGWSGVPWLPLMGLCQVSC